MGNLKKYVCWKCVSICKMDTIQLCEKVKSQNLQENE